jgi:excisionase family DNA binding protein
MEHQRSKKPGIAPIPPPTLLTVREVSEYLRVHPTTVYRLARSKQFPGFRVGSDWRFSIEAIDRWLSGEGRAAVSARSDRKRPE